MSRVAITFIVLLPVTQDVDASEAEALAVAAEDPAGLGAAHKALSTVLLEVMGRALAEAPRASMGAPQIVAVPGDHQDLASALTALLEAPRGAV